MGADSSGSEARSPSNRTANGFESSSRNFLAARDGATASPGGKRSSLLAADASPQPAPGAASVWQSESRAHRLRFARFRKTETQNPPRLGRGHGNQGHSRR